MNKYLWISNELTHAKDMDLCYTVSAQVRVTLLLLFTEHLLVFLELQRSTALEHDHLDSNATST